MESVNLMSRLNKRGDVATYLIVLVAIAGVLVSAYAYAGFNNDLESETKETGRKYLTPDGKAYPSITTVLSILTRKAIMEWRKRVGEEEANKISRQAAGRGTDVHAIIEKAVQNDMWCNEYAGVTWDIMTMACTSAKYAKGNCVYFKVRINGAGRKKYYTFKFAISSGDDGKPVFTIMMPHED